MARSTKYKYTLDKALGISADKIVGYSTQDIKDYIIPMRDAIRKRIRRLEKANLRTPAMARLEKTGGLLSINKEKRSDLISEFRRGLQFLNYETSTVKGARAYMKKHNMGREVEFMDMDKEEFARYWDIVHKLQYSPYGEVDEEQYTTTDNAIRSAVTSEDPVKDFLLNVPEGAREYIEFMSAMDKDKDVDSLSAKEYMDYTVEKLTAMAEAYRDYNYQPEDYIKRYLERHRKK